MAEQRGDRPAPARRHHGPRPGRRVGSIPSGGHGRRVGQDPGGGPPSARPGRHVALPQPDSPLDRRGVGDHPARCRELRDAAARARHAASRGDRGADRARRLPAAHCRNAHGRGDAHGRNRRCRCRRPGEVAPRRAPSLVRHGFHAGGAEHELGNRRVRRGGNRPRRAAVWPRAGHRSRTGRPPFGPVRCFVIHRRFARGPQSTRPRRAAARTVLGVHGHAGRPRGRQPGRPGRRTWLRLFTRPHGPAERPRHRRIAGDRRIPRPGD